ncbi:MAG: hypothetical protein E7262_00700 [Lachnospiraceae bacterium]|nr:hypothetical protein [Lachnospiraceae bacterium]
MMEYQEFKKVVEEQLKEYVPEPYRSMEWDSHKVEKVNQTLDAINFRSTESGMSVSPTVYINTMYEQYKNGEQIDDILRDVAGVIVRAVKEKDKIIPDLDFENAKDNIVFQLINTEQNKEMLEHVPHREFQDLSIIYRWVVNRNDEGLASILIKDNVAKQLGLSENQLFDAAKENTKKLLPIAVRPMGEVLMDIMMKDGMPCELAEIMLNTLPAKKQMYVISNEIGVNGASAMLYEEGLEELSNIFESDIYIMPSSVHECIAISSELGDPNELAEMVESINMDQVELKDRLSNQVYFYDKETKQVSLASNNPNKRLDGMVAETNGSYDIDGPSR